MSGSVAFVVQDVTKRYGSTIVLEEATVSIHVMWGLKQQNPVFAIGKSILNRESQLNIGELCLRYEGGGHFNAGTCQIDNDVADETLAEVIATITGEDTLPEAAA